MRATAPATAVTTAVTTAALALALSACSSTSKPSHDAVKGKIKADASFAALKDSQIDCLTDVFIRYGDAGSLRSYVAGKTTLENVQGPKGNDGKIKTDAAKCIRA